MCVVCFFVYADIFLPHVSRISGNGIGANAIRSLIKALESNVSVTSVDFEREFEHNGVAAFDVSLFFACICRMQSRRRRRASIVGPAHHKFVIDYNQFDS